MTTGEWLVSISSVPSGTALELLSTVTGDSGGITWIPAMSIDAEVTQSILDASISYAVYSADISQATIDASISAPILTANISQLKLEGKL